MVCNILIISVTIFTAIMGFNYVNVTSLSYIHLPKKFFLIFAGSIEQDNEAKTAKMMRFWTVQEVREVVVMFVNFF